MDIMLFLRCSTITGFVLDNMEHFVQLRLPEVLVNNKLRAELVSVVLAAWLE